MEDPWTRVVRLEANSHQIATVKVTSINKISLSRILSSTDYITLDWILEVPVRGSRALDYAEGVLIVDTILERHFCSIDYNHTP